MTAGTGLGAFERGGDRTAEEIDRREHVPPRSFPDTKVPSSGYKPSTYRSMGRDGRESPRASSIADKDTTVNGASAID